MTKSSVKTTLIGFIALGIIGTILFHVRYPFSFELSNFYAEDGKIFMKNLLEKGPVLGSLTLFNGYLIVGQYLVGVLGLIINFFAGNDFITLAKALAVASYTFLGFVCALPWLLFRKKIGSLLAIIVFLLLVLTPLGGYDYAVIGTIGNLKFAFLFIAFLLVVYRNDKNLSTRWWQLLIVDAALLLCVATNIVVVGLLPFVLIRYWKPLKSSLKLRSFDVSLKSYGFLAVVGMGLLTCVYVLIVYIKGIPAMPGYLDGKLHHSALAAIAYRSTTYGLTFPLSYLFNGFFAVLSMVFFVVVLFAKKVQWPFAVTTCFALLFNVAGFVYNRPGVTEYFMSYQQGGWPGHFFYAGTMITVFAFAYVCAKRFNGMKILTQAGLVVCVILAVALVLPAAGSTKASPYAGAASRPTLAEEVERTCAVKPFSNEVAIGLYPNDKWSTTLNRNVVCGKD